MTLIEVVMAISILLLMTTIGWSAIMGSVQMNDALSQRDETVRAARVAMSTMRRELQTAFLTENIIAANQYRTVFVGEDGDPDTLYFASFSHKRMYQDSRESDQTELTWWVERGDSDVTGEGDVLYHREALRIDEEPDRGGRIAPLAYHVDSFNLRYLHPVTGEWVDEWDTRNADHRNMLPRAVQIGLVLLAPDPDDPDRTVKAPFLTTVMLEYADPLRRQFGQDPSALEQTQ